MERKENAGREVTFYYDKSSRNADVEINASHFSEKALVAAMLETAEELNFDSKPQKL